MSFSKDQKNEFIETLYLKMVVNSRELMHVILLICTGVSDPRQFINEYNENGGSNIFRN